MSEQTQEECPDCAAPSAFRCFLCGRRMCAKHAALQRRNNASSPLEPPDLILRPICSSCYHADFQAEQAGGAK